MSFCLIGVCVCGVLIRVCTVPIMKSYMQLIEENPSEQLIATRPTTAAVSYYVGRYTTLSGFV